MEVDASKLWALQKEGNFGFFSIVSEVAKVRALWLRDAKYEDPDDGTHGIITEPTQKFLREEFEGTTYVFKPSTDLPAIFLSGKLRAIKIKESFGGGHIILVPGKEFEIIGTQSVSPAWESENRDALQNLWAEAARKPLFNMKSDAELAKESREMEVKTDPNRRIENLIINDAKRVLSILDKAAVETAGSGSSKSSYPDFMLSAHIWQAMALMLPLNLAWYLTDTGLLGTLSFTCVSLAILGAFYYRWFRARRLFNINEDEVYDVYYLSKLGLVEGFGTGQSITTIFGVVNNLSTKKLQVRMMPGTYFKSTGEHQNMASTVEYSFVLNPLNGQHIEVKATCINASRPIPSATDSFEGLGVTSKKVRRFLQKAHGEDSMTIQAGVWACTDNFSGDQIKKHLISSDTQGNRFSAVSDGNIQRARSILDELNISTNL
ncbi:hypothetical protein MNBD_GAMMA26-360 [hydrothermal vent metagenome]|uniref:Uncharacterized protein n=1 Tax=hydrothermal vent metagenome TaxID=652676 RepID=A0A3B1B535_9ZZZZ